LAPPPPPSFPTRPSSDLPDDAYEVAFGEIESDELEDLELLSVLEIGLRDVLHFEERMHGQASHLEPESLARAAEQGAPQELVHRDRKSTRLNSSHQIISS